MRYEQYFIVIVTLTQFYRFVSVTTEVTHLA